MDRKKAITIVKNNWPHNSFTMLREALETLIPELKESEDEKIKKNIKIALMSMEDNLTNFYSTHHTSQKELLAWLEKQGESSKTDTAYRPHKGDVGNPDEQGKKIIPLEDIIHNVWELGNLWKELTNGVCTTEHGRQIDYIVKHWKEGEHYIKSVEKLCGQKPINKAVPKFKVGDWIFCDGLHPALILNIVEDKYEIEFTDDGTKGFLPIDLIDRHYHLWIIKDAKDGDILTLKDDKGPFIFKGFDKHHPECPVAHCGIDAVGVFMVAGFGWWTNEEVEPATKEQRDFLFARMKEAGYEWDAEKKELIGSE